MSKLAVLVESKANLERLLDSEQVVELFVDRPAIYTPNAPAKKPDMMSLLDNIKSDYHCRDPEAEKKSEP